MPKPGRRILQQMSRRPLRPSTAPFDRLRVSGIPGAARVVLVLHAHLPWVAGTREERWLHEAILDCYLPLLEVLEKLPDGARRITVSISPVLCAMWNDRGARKRTAVYLREQHARSTGWHQQNAARALASFRKPLIARFRALARRGAIELITTAVTHGFLPLLMTVPEAARAQVALAVESHRRCFGAAPKGFWLPECGYAPGLDAVLAEAGLRYTFLDAHALDCSPAFLPSGVAAFTRDPLASEQVWSAQVGYPADPLYADFHHRVDGQRVLRVTGAQTKEPWEPQAAFARAREHARHFLEQRRAGPRVQVAPYDAELFGHWWLEGPVFLDALLTQGADVLTTPSEVLRAQPTLPVRDAEFSSWGRGGHASVWLGPQNGWMWPHLHRAAETMVTLAGTRSRGLAMQQLLLAQGSDWPFLLDAKTSAGFAHDQFVERLLAFRALAAGTSAAHAPNPFPWAKPSVYRRARAGQAQPQKSRRAARSGAAAPAAAGVGQGRGRSNARRRRA
jgi:1,4-alpha-glucan branching enzyme